MKKILLLAALLFPLCLGAGNRKYDVYLCIGQSNMAGRGELLPEDSKPVEGVFLLDEDGNVVPATAQANIYSSIRKSKSTQGYNLSIAFAQKMYRANGRPVLLVVNARGGTGLDLWVKDAGHDTFSKSYGDQPEWVGKEMPQFYSEAVRRTRQALKYGKLKAILWHQGESDDKDGLREVYLDKIKGMVRDLRKDLKAGKAPFIVGEMYDRTRKINGYLKNIPSVIPNSAFVTSEGCTSKPDKLHFNRDGIILLGERYADAYMELK